MTIYPKSLVRLFQLAKLDKAEISSIYFYAILSGIAQLSVPVGIQAIIGFVMGATMVTSIFVLITLVVLGVLVIGILQMSQMKIIEKIQQKIFTRYAFDIAERLPRIDLLKTDTYYLPEKVNRFLDTITVQKGWAKLLLDLPTVFIQIVFGLILLSLYHPLFIVFGIILILIVALIMYVTGNKGLNTSIEESNYKYSVIAWLQEMARVILTFKYSQGSHLNLRKTDTLVSNYLQARTKHFNVLMFQYQMLVGFKVLITLSMLSIGTFLLLSQKLNIGEFIAAEIVILTIISAVEKLIARLDTIYDVLTSLQKLSDLTECEVEQSGSISLQSVKSGVDIELQHVAFTYPNGKIVLRDINLSIPKNSITVIQNKEGTGKTTLLKIISGNITKYEGTITINSIPVQNYSLESIRHNSSFMINQQDIFAASAWDNISMGHMQVSREDVLSLANEMGIDTVFNSLPMGMDTYLDPAGKRSNTTLIKSILLLRTFCGSPSLVLLEDPISGFDIATQEKIIQYIHAYSKQATILIASEDQMCKEIADQWVLLKNGKIQQLKNQ